ncbi:MAG TPA: hypothetical protein VFN26_22640 [Candidatus Acidoferrum sp.]|nr:hypothetical protein [Candidatus Acidoferrum sp.]
MGIRMGINQRDRVEEHRAAILLGLPQSELRRYSEASGLGHLEAGDRGEQMVFTYEELRRLCLLAAQSSK